MLDKAPFDIAESELSPRQREVLTAALDLMVELGDGLTMTAVAQRASCSKETLYKWFGARDGLLTATVQWQAAKVKLPALDVAHLDADALRTCLEQFAENWLTVLTGEISIALNRLAVGHAGSAKSGLGRIVLHNGPFAMARRLKPIMQLGREAGLLKFDDAETAFRSFFGLVVRDVQIRALLGDDRLPSARQNRRDAERATNQFLALYGAGSAQQQNERT
jgi:AcrR family transcriptional regulator